MTRTFSIPPCTKYRPFTISQKVLSCNLLRTKETFNLKKKNDFLSPARGKLLVLFRQIFKDKHCLCRCSLLHTWNTNEDKIIHKILTNQSCIFRSPDIECGRLDQMKNPLQLKLMQMYWLVPCLQRLCWMIFFAAWHGNTSGSRFVWHWRLKQSILRGKAKTR